MSVAPLLLSKLLLSRLISGCLGLGSFSLRGWVALIGCAASRWWVVGAIAVATPLRPIQGYHVGWRDARRCDGFAV